jgi:iturin family lipopeptide synthetase A
MISKDIAYHGDEIAIIGMVGRFPGANHIDQFWQNLLNGIESITTFSDEELLAVGIDPALLSRPDYVKSKGILDHVEYFDAAFFGVSPREAAIMDPQHRQFLECAWEALESAGYNAENYEQRIGVYASVGVNTYWLNIFSNPELIDLVGPFQIGIGNDKDSLATRVSYKLNLKGPSVVVQTACSSSLVAVHLACQSLLNGECEMALAGGIAIQAEQKAGYVYHEGDIYSPDGHCRAFDAKAQGTVFSSGAGIVVLKRLSDAIDDNDSIYAVIKGSAINNDGSAKVGYTAPSVQGQAEVIADALAIARVKPGTIGYVETHGTGTAIGDPIEIAALNRVFRDSGQKPETCAIGSVKSNIGHVDVAAGIAGLIKTVLALKYQQLPPSLHFEHPNPQIEFINGPFYVNTELTNWQAGLYPRRAAVSSFGIGGTNAHVVLEEAPGAESGPAVGQWNILLLSARTKTALEVATANLAGYLDQHRNLNLSNVAYTLQVGRKSFSHRRMVLFQNYDDAIATLTTANPKQMFTTAIKGTADPIVFMFPGQGAQYINMALDLYKEEPVFRAEVDQCAQILKQHVSFDLLALLYPSAEQREHMATQLDQTKITQPALFVIEYALAKLWMSWGIRPQAMIGHSLGEYVAACLAGVFSLEDALALVAMRGQLMQQLPTGGMLVVPLSEHEVVSLLESDLSLAAVNGPNICVISGRTKAVEALHIKLISQGIECRRLHTSHAFHSIMMEPILAAFTERLQHVRLNAPKLPFISNLTGTWITAQEAMNPSHWARHLRETVRFSTGIQTLLEERNYILLEIGPGHTLSTLARQQADRVANTLILSSLHYASSDQSDMQLTRQSLGQLWLAGISVQWNQLYKDERCQRISLPTYPFERQRHWVELRQERYQPSIHSLTPPSYRKASDYFYVPSWKQSYRSNFAAAIRQNAPQDCVLVFIDSGWLNDQIMPQLRQRFKRIIRVQAGEGFRELSESHFVVNPQQLNDYQALINKISAHQWLPQFIMHFWSVTPDVSEPEVGYYHQRVVADSLASLYCFVQSFKEQQNNAELQIVVVSNHIQDVTGEEQLATEKAAILGACGSIPQIYPGIVCRSVDIVISETRIIQELINQLCNELIAPLSESVVAYRGRYRWLQTLEPVSLGVMADLPPRLREGQVYLITGDVGYIGFNLINYLLSVVRVKVALISDKLPLQADVSSSINTQSIASNILQAPQSLAKYDMSILRLQANGTDAIEMQLAIKQVQQHFGVIHGVIHLIEPAIENGMGSGSISDMLETVETFLQRIRVLDQLYTNLEFGFLTFCSTLEALLGRSDHISHNIVSPVVAALARQHTIRDDRYTLATSWDVQQFLTSEPTVLVSEQHNDAAPGVAHMWELILRNNLPHVMVSTQDIAALVERHATNRANSEADTASIQLRPAPHADASWSEVERVVAGIWHELLGIEHLDRADNFFALGGHSLLATQAVARIRNAFQIELPLRTFFEEPTIQGLATVIETKLQAGTGQETPVLVQEPRIGELLLSFAQQRLWFIDQLLPGNPFYNVPAAVHLRGDLHIIALEQSLQAVVQRHEVLRTTFGSVDGRPRQVIRGEWHIPLILVDLQEIPDGERERELRRLIFDETHHPFDLSIGPLIRACVYRLHMDEHVLVLTLHHIISDAWSVGVFVKEFATYYEAFSTGTTTSMPELVVQYADFALWQHKWLQGSIREKQIVYWCKQLENIAVLQLQTDHPRPSLETFRGAQQMFTLSHSVGDGLKEFSRRERVTLFMVLLTGFKTLLHRYSGQDDIAVGTSIANRTRVEVEGLIGFFVNMLVLRTDLSGNPSLRDLVVRVRKTALDAYANQDIPFEQLVEELHPARDTSHAPFFQVSFELHNAPLPTLELPALSLTPLQIETATTKYDLMLEMMDTDAGLQGWLTYNTDLFDAPTMTRLISHFQTILAGLVADPTQRLSTVAMLTPSERHQLLVEWNATAYNYPRTQCFHQLFEAQVAHTPDAVAVSVGVTHLTYHQLNQQANIVAHQLRILGIGPDTIVALLAPRGISFLITILAIFKAGGAYLPLDPRHPPQRIAQVLTRSRTPLVLGTLDFLPTLEQACTHLPADYDPCVQSIDILLAASQAADNLSIPVSPSHLAYVIYTSGSTGMPKGVMVEHGGMINHLYAKIADLKLSKVDIIAQTASQCFDISVWQFLVALLIGGRVEIIGDEEAHDPAVLLAKIPEHRITVLETVPSMLQALLDEAARPGGTPFEWKTVRWLLSTGEALSPELCRRWFAQAPDLPLLNAYGPTECSDDVTHHPILQAPLAEIGRMPIGHPIANTQLYVLDRELQPVSIGVQGELYVGGAGVGRGYLHEPGHTAAAFIPDPYSPLPGVRLYKTGDIVRMLADGTLEFLGRSDQQVKLRGFRIELGEIESAISQHPNVLNNVVLLHEELPNDKRLVAYIVQSMEYNDLAKQEVEAVISAEQVSHWQMLYDQTYHETEVPRDRTFNIAGWDSSYTGQRIPEEEMREWVDYTVAQILAFHPAKVLEIGCGTGMLLFRIAPHCDGYCGIDFSQTALHDLQQQVQQVGLSQVRLLHREASNLEGFEQASFDTVIINSVAQYFPSIDYLVEVIKGAIQVVKPGGRIYIGDVRNLAQLEAFHASVQLHHVPAEWTKEQFRQQVQMRMLQEEELVVHPKFFTALQEDFAIDYVQVMLKRGHYHNELTRFRYNVILHVGQIPEPMTDIHWLDWEQDDLSLVSLRHRLELAAPAVVGITRVPNARVLTALQTVDWLTNAEEPTTVGQFRDTLQNIADAGVDPEVLHAMSDELSYTLETRWSSIGNKGTYDLVLYRQNSELRDLRWASPGTSNATAQRMLWREYANNPLQDKLGRALIAQIRQLLQIRLPEYMMPSSFVLIPALPLTPNGKVDRRSLLAIKNFKTDSLTNDISPRTDVETLLAGIWIDVLGLDQIGIHTNFFEVGGHSLLATQIISRIRDIFRVELPLRLLFESPTIVETAKHIENALGAGLQNLPLVPVTRDGPLPLSYAQQRLWFLTQLEPKSPFYNIPVALRMQGPLNVPALEQSLNEIVRRHEVLRTVFDIIDGQPTQNILAELIVKIHLIDLRPLSVVDREAQARQLVIAEASQPFDLKVGPLLRATLLRIDDTEHWALLTMHHIVSDGWSTGVLIQEVMALYEAFVLNRSPMLPILPIQYADYASWQRQWLQDDVLDVHTAYWKRQLAGAPPLLSLPSDRPRPLIQTYQGTHSNHSLPPTLTQHIDELSRREGFTRFMILLAAFQVLLHYYTGSDDIVVGSDIANRNRGETESLIGFFVNQIVLRTNVSGNPTFRELLVRVRQIALDSYAHQDLPFDKLVQALNPERYLGYAPLFQIKLVLQNMPGQQAVSLPNLTLSPIEVDPGTSQLDLNLRIMESLDGLILSAEYSTVLFDAARITRLLKHYDMLLRTAIADTSAKMSMLIAILADADKQQQSMERTLLQHTSVQKLREIKRRAVERPSHSQDGATSDE